MPAPIRPAELVLLAREAASAAAFALLAQRILVIGEAGHLRARVNGGRIS